MTVHIRKITDSSIVSEFHVNLVDHNLVDVYDMNSNVIVDGNMYYVTNYYNNLWVDIVALVVPFVVCYNDEYYFILFEVNDFYHNRVKYYKLVTAGNTPFQACKVLTI